MTKLTNKLIADLPIKIATYIVWDDVSSKIRKVMEME